MEWKSRPILQYGLYTTLSMKPDVLICDESVSALNVYIQAQALNLLQDLQDEYKLSYTYTRKLLASTLVGWPRASARTV